MRPLVIGVGNRWRGDDGFGPQVIGLLACRDGLDADLVSLDGEPTRIIAAWTGRPSAVVVDVVVAGDPPGTIHLLTDLDRLPSPPRESSSHGAGVIDAIALGRAIDRLPDRLTVVGVEPAALDHGKGLSPPVAASLDAAVDHIVEALGAARTA